MSSNRIDGEKRPCYRIAEARAHAGLTQRELAEAIGTSIEQLESWETGKKDIRGRVLYNIAKATGVSLNYLMNFSNSDDDYSGESVPVKRSIRGALHIPPSQLDTIGIAIGREENRGCYSNVFNVRIRGNEAIIDFYFDDGIERGSNPAAILVSRVIMDAGELASLGRAITMLAN